MPEISTFFKESDSKLGIFYPTHYIVISFPSEKSAADADEALSKSGLADDDVLSMHASDALAYFENFRKEKGVFGDVMTSVSRALGDDATFVDRDIENAQKGSAFLIVRSETDEESARIRQIVRPFEPLTMHWYVGGGIQSLI